MKRRDAVLLPLVVGTAGVQLHMVALAQISNTPRKIGILMLDADPKTPVAQRPIMVVLKKLGWSESENLTIERGYAELKAERLAGLAEELVRKRVELVIAWGPEAALAAARATRTIPVAFFSVVWPVEQGLIDSFARPGRNVTGVSYCTGVEVTNKRLEFLRDIAPAAKRLSFLWPSDYAQTLGGSQFDMVPLVESAAKGLGFETRFHPVHRAEDIDAAFAEITRWGATALAAAGSHVSVARQRIAEFALRSRLPSAFPQRDNVEAGGLLSYAPPASEFGRMFLRGLGYVDRILRGAQPADLPVERPSKYELVINLKAAKALGLTPPQSLLLRADEVIQ